MSKDEVRLSIEEEEQEEEMEIPPSDEDTTPHKDHVFNNSDEDLLRDLKKQEAKTTSIDHQAGQNGRRKVLTKIQKVPKIVKLRDKSLKQYFTPSEISIGPVHAQTNKLIKRDLKLRLAARFVAESKQTAETLFGKVKDDIAKLKKCYDKNVVKPFDDDHLARILFLDGCSVLQFIHGFVRNNLNELKISTGQSGSIQNDLFLLENQVPFQLLKLLIISSVEKFKLVQSVYEFLAANIMSPPDYYGQRHSDNLFGLKSTRLVPQKEPFPFDEDKEPVHLLDLLRSELLFGWFVENDHETIDCRDLQMFYKRSFRNVQDLKAAGIKFKPSKSSSFRAVSFSTRWLITGRLSLPPMIVDNSTASKLWNLVAYEMCHDNYGCDFGVSSYLRLLDSLIDNEQDVRDLRAEHVLRNRLSSDKEVARLFNTIGSNLVSKDAYLGVKIKIQRHYERKCAVWVAQVYHDHFSSPWTVLALFAAVVALLLTGFSTWYTVYPKK